ncbi:MAG: class I SAM-dependent methyltransferase [Mycobacterium sp.]
MDSAIDKLRAGYDESPYPLNSYPQSAPGQLAAVAHLFGLDVPPVAHARVLEIGSAVGGNLIPFAAQHPRAHVVGVDLSPAQTAQARQYVESAGLDNVTLLEADISDIDVAALGSFDYVVCHGVYSWVPEKVRESILAVMQDVLSPNGVGYVSYNVYPGWKSKEILRDAMLLASADAVTPAARVQAAREAVEFLGEVALPGGASARAVADHRAVAAAHADPYLLHDELELFNTPCYFAEFVRAAQSHGLAYVAEAQPEYMFPGNFGADLASRLAAKCGDDQVRLQQYLDIAINRSFRQSLLVHAGRTPDIRHTLDRTRFDALHVAAWLPPVDGETRLDGSSQEFRGNDAGSLMIADPVHKVALDVLNASWPWTMSRAELVDSVQVSLPFARGTDRLESRIDELLELMVVHGQARYRLDRIRPQQYSRFQLDDPARRLAEATRGDSDAYSFTAWHETMVLTPFDRYLLPLMDGTRDRAALVEAMLGYARRRVIGFHGGGRELTGDAQLREAIGLQIDRLSSRLPGLQLTEVAELSDERQSTPA